MSTDPTKVDRILAALRGKPVLAYALFQKMEHRFLSPWSSLSGGPVEGVFRPTLTEPHHHVATIDKTDSGWMISIANTPSGQRVVRTIQPTLDEAKEQADKILVQLHYFMPKDGA